jgi:predicted RNA-binding Zn ribbon-like protein
MDESIPAPAADLCLEFADTRYWRGTATPADELNDMDDVRQWAAAKARIPTTLIRSFAGELQDVLALRETIYRCFAATASGGAPAETDLSAFNAALAEAPVRQRVQPGGWLVASPAHSASTLLAPVLWSAADLLVGPQLQRVHMCANPECGWLFLDNSKSGNRRWCSMSACGNRAKAHRHYQRQKNG